MCVDKYISVCVCVCVCVRERERERERERMVFIDAVWCYVDQREMLMSDGEISTKIKSNAHFRLD